MRDDAAPEVLLVGGCEVLRDRLATLLAAGPSGFRLSWLKDVDQAHTPLAEGRFAAALLAYEYNPAAAYDLLRGASHAAAITPVIAVTERLDRDLDQQALALGATDYLPLATLDAAQLDRALRFARVRRQSARQLVAARRADTPTGLSSRHMFCDDMAALLQQAKPTDCYALLHINIDGFSRINDAYGHAIGDLLVRQVAQRLISQAPAGLLGRLGGDEFGLLLAQLAGESEALAVAQQIAGLLAAPYPLDHEGLVAIAVSIGVALAPQAGTDAVRLLRYSEIAMRSAKRVRGNQCHVYSPQLSQACSDQVRLEAELRRALRRNEFMLVYQPRVALESGEINGVEALLRWRHPRRGLIGPDTFIPVAEESGLIVPLGYWVMQQACRDMRRLDLMGLPRLDVALNLSFKQLLDEKFAETTIRLLDHANIDSRRVEFELTETAIMHNDRVAHAAMLALSALGVSFSLDDFGTGYSSFAHIQRLPIAALKIDRSFVRELPANHDDAVIVKAIIALAHNLQLRVIAEGAETLEQVQFLWQQQCDQVQGYYFSPPVPLAQLAELLGTRAMAAV